MSAETLFLIGSALVLAALAMGVWLFFRVLQEDRELP